MNVINRASLSADDVTDVLRVNARMIGDALWEVESARSMLRKAQAGYRASEGLGDGVWDIDTYQRRLEHALLKANQLIHRMSLTGRAETVPQYTALVDRVKPGTIPPEGLRAFVGDAL